MEISTKTLQQFDKTFWKNQRVLVTGGGGFLGSHIVRLLLALEPQEIRVPRSKDYDLREKAACAAVVKDITLVIHLAANVGGIGYNQEHPGKLFYDNLLMGVHMMEESRKANVAKFVAIGTICAYPKFTPVPFKEEDLWNGYPEETNAPYGLAKKMMLVQGRAYRQEYGFNSIYLLPVNLYGPGDNFDPGSSHVIPALIRKFVEAKGQGADKVVVWGTGTPTREFLYVDDAARGILLAGEKYEAAEPVNLGSSFEITIKGLAETVKKVVGFEGDIVFDADKPDGQPRRKLDVSRAREGFGFESEVQFPVGLQETVEWYVQQNSHNE
jgi:GDP-L-fucose synthase